MASPIRYFQKDSFYHIYNRGNRKQNIFIVNRDYARFLKRSKEYKDKFGITILCYCLMPNHFHFLLRQDSEISITTFMLRLCTSYAKYFNLKYDEVGSLFQSPFKSKAVETEEYLLQLSRYIHQNPKEILPSIPSTRGVELASYLWSSYPSYINEITNDLVDPAFVLSYFAKNNPRDDYKNFVKTDFKDEDIDLIKDLILEDY